MQETATLLRGLSPTAADALEGNEEWTKSPASTLSDAALINGVAAAIAAPKRAADTSFLTHAPLELAARAGLLPMVAPQARDQARRRIAAIAGEYAQAGEEIETAAKSYADERAACHMLISSLHEGDADEVDAALVYLALRLPLRTLRRLLVDEVTPHLGAAGHAPILLAELPRLEARVAAVSGLLRAPLRQIAKMPDVRISWCGNMDDISAATDAERVMFQRLAAPPPVASESVYIAQTMKAVEANGFAARMLADVTAGMPVEGASRVFLRTGALAMLQDDARHAPYGWSHALTMPQGVLANADASGDKIALVRVAATHALGFRATLGKTRLVDEPPPRPRQGDYFNVDPIEAAGAVYHAGENETPSIRTALATRAATHGDAHLAKYTLACFDAAARDPEASRLFLAAAAYLGAWWDAHPDASFE